MSNVDDVITFVFEWESQPNACPKCASLNRKQWITKNLDQPTINDDVLGPVWDLTADRSLMHGGSGTCKCHLWVRVEITYSQLDSFRDLAVTSGRMM